MLSFAVKLGVLTFMCYFDHLPKNYYGLRTTFMTMQSLPEQDSGFKEQDKTAQSFSLSSKLSHSQSNSFMGCNKTKEHTPTSQVPPIKPKGLLPLSQFHVPQDTFGELPVHVSTGQSCFGVKRGTNTVIGWVSISWLIRVAFIMFYIVSQNKSPSNNTATVMTNDL